MELKTKNSKEIISFFNSISIISDFLRKLQSVKPQFNGEHYLTDKQLSQKLNLSRRTLQDYRNQGIIPYIHIGGKVLYRESDVTALLEKSYIKAWRENNT